VLEWNGVSVRCERRLQGWGCKRKDEWFLLMMKSVCDLLVVFCLQVEIEL